MISFDVPNDPNPARLIGSLRHVGYGNYEAIADIVDNSFDADADLVVIEVSKHRDDFRISIADNGTGMDREVLDQALRLGSLTERDLATDLGKFGMGLVTASLSLARRTSVITKPNGQIWSSTIDVDAVEQSNRFCKELREGIEQDAEVFQKFLGNSATGTVVILTSIDAMQNKNVTQFSNILAKHLGETHRFFLISGKRIVVNGNEVEAIDPLMWEHSETEHFSDELYPVEIEDAGGRSIENIRARIAIIPEDAATGEHSLAVALKHQGFYVLRNLRQIARAMTLELFTKHNDFNRMRGEIFFSGKFDRYIGIEFTKRGVNFDQAIQDKLAEHLRSQCTTIKRRMAGRSVTAATDRQQHLHEQASKAITEKNRLLLTPKAIIEKRRPRAGVKSNPRPVGGMQANTERTNFRDTQQVDSRLRCRFLHQKLGPNGQIFECDMEGRTVVIRWNIEHPFFRRFIADNQNDGRIVTAVDFLVYSMATAELRARNEDNVDFINSFKAVISANLRTLLS